MLVVSKLSRQMTWGKAEIAKLGEHQTEDLNVRGSIPSIGIMHR